MAVQTQKKSDRLHFEYLPGFAGFILDKYHEAFVREQLRLSKDVNLPLLSLLQQFGEEKLIEMSMVTTGEFLNHLKKNEAGKQIDEAFKRWMSDELPVLSRDQIISDDITLFNYVRKQAFLKFLPHYTSEVSKTINVIREIDLFLLESETKSVTGYIRLLKNRINDEVHFKERITNTTPGIVYVYDLLDQKTLYVNEKVGYYLGYDEKDLTDSNGSLFARILHPDDIERATEHIQQLQSLKDQEIQTFEYRARSKTGMYLWFRAYESVFRRKEDGTTWQVIGSAIDINKEKDIQEQLAYREAQLLEAQEIAQLGSFEWDLLTGESQVTPELVKILGLEHTHLSAFMANVHPEDRNRVEAALQEATEKTGNYDAEFRYILNGREKIIWSRGVVSFDPNGTAMAMRGTVLDITERHQFIQRLKESKEGYKHLVERLQQSEELYKQAQALSHIGNWSIDLDTNSTYWTDEMYRIYGLEPQSIQLTYETFLELVHPEDRELVRAFTRQAIKAKAPFDMYHRNQWKDGTIKSLHIRGEVVTDEDGHVKQIFGTAQDVTRQQLTEQQLRENRNFIQKIADATPSIITSYNINTGKYRFVSQGITKLLGYDPEVAMENGVAFFMDMIHPDDLPSLIEKNNAALQAANETETEMNDIIVDWQYRMRHSNGHYRWFHTFGTIFDRNVDGKVEHVLNISIDITDKIEAERKVLEQELFIKHIADASPTVLYLFDALQGSIIYINREIESVLGYTPEEMIRMGGSVIQQLYHPEDAKLIPERLHEYNNSTQPQSLFQFECRMKHHDGTWRWLLIHEIVFKRDRDGRILEVLGAALDISHRKEMENMLVQKTRELEQSNASLEEFAYVASHDLKEPLRKISTFGDRLITTQKDLLDDDGKNYLEKIIQSSRRMQQMINDLLSVSLIAGEKTFERVSLQSLLNDVIQTLEYKIEETKTILDIQPLPEAHVIASQFRQVFQNIISNSLKFVQPGVQPKITVRYDYLQPGTLTMENITKANRYLRITFTDNGIGFNEAFSDKIFAIFQRLHNKSDYEGTGIGLSICKKIVENHGGLIVADGKLNKGATFTIIIPV